MPVNLELKAKVTRPKKILRTLQLLGKPSEKLVQTDTYFPMRRGRLKLREFGNGKSELIQYVRNETKGRRWSRYDILHIPDASAAKRFLKRLFGIDVIVKKSRRVYYYKKKARIHFDTVKGLGMFVEFEVYSTKDPRLAVALYRELVEFFGIEKEDIIRGSYADLMRKRR